MENATWGELCKAANKVSTPVVSMWTSLEISQRQRNSPFSKEKSLFGNVLLAPKAAASLYKYRSFLQHPPCLFKPVK